MKHLKRIFENVDNTSEIFNILTDITDEYDFLKIEDLTEIQPKYTKFQLLIKISGFDKEFAKFESPATLDYLIFYRDLINLIVNTSVRIKDITNFEVNVSGINSIGDNANDSNYIYMYIYDL